MNSATVASIDSRAALRRWACGLPSLEAAVELLVRSCHGRLAEPRWPWIRVDDGCLWLDTDQLSGSDLDLVEPERQVLGIVDALASGRPIGQLADHLALLDRATLQLVLAAFAHAGRSHTHRVFRRDGDGSARWQRLDPLIGWNCE